MVFDCCFLLQLACDAGEKPELLITHVRCQANPPNVEN